MNYRNQYNKFIEYRLAHPPKYQYFEKHHIIPKCVGGGDDDSNLVRVTAREHYILHHLLTKIYPKNNKLQYALEQMKLTPRYIKPISKRKYKQRKLKTKQPKTKQPKKEKKNWFIELEEAFINNCRTYSKQHSLFLEITNNINKENESLYEKHAMYWADELSSIELNNLIEDNQTIIN